MKVTTDGVKKSLLEDTSLKSELPSKGVVGGEGIRYLFCKTINCFEIKAKSFPWEEIVPSARDQSGSSDAMMRLLFTNLFASKQAQMLCAQWAFSCVYMWGRDSS